MKNELINIAYNPESQIILTIIASILMCFSVYKLLKYVKNPNDSYNFMLITLLFFILSLTLFSLPIFNFTTQTEVENYINGNNKYSKELEVCYNKLKNEPFKNESLGFKQIVVTPSSPVQYKECLTQLVENPDIEEKVAQENEQFIKKYEQLNQSNDTQAQQCFNELKDIKDIHVVKYGRKYLIEPLENQYKVCIGLNLLNKELKHN